MKYLLYFLTCAIIALLIPILTVGYAQFSCADVSEIPQLECEALVAFYQSTNGPGWIVDTNWLVTNTPSDWVGVYVTSGHVTALAMRENNITGSLPQEIGNLTSLTWLSLEENGITGSIPQEIGNLVNLTELEIGWNSFSNSIPAELGNITTLRELSLISNTLSGSIPAELGNLINLTYLDFSGNMLSGVIPPELGQMAALEFLNLGNNQLSGRLSPELGNFASLQALFLFNNPGLSGRLPFSLTNLTLDSFWYDETGLCNPPDPIFQTWLRSIPGLWSTWELCDSAALCADITEIPQPACSGLVELYYSTNGGFWSDCSKWFVTNTPSNWYGVTVISGMVSELNLDSNNLTGNLPPEMENLIGLLKINLSNNSIGGSLPIQLGNLPLLSVMNLSGNELDGVIPAELGNLTSVTEFDLSHNLFTGSIPPELGNLSNLQRLNLGNNDFNGSLPATLGNLAYLKDLIFENNQISGIIPPEFGNMTSLNQMNLSGNQLIGSIPIELINLNSLERMDLSRNQLNSNLPAELGSMASLVYLDLSQNQLSGSIPAQFGQQTLMGYLDLGHNHLSGNVPTQIGDMLNLSYLHLDDNLLDGNLPSSLANLVNLSDPGQYNGEDGLDLDYNFFNIPANYPAPGDPFQEFLYLKDPDWHVYQAFEQLISVGGGELTSLDGRTDIIIPEGALITDTQFTFIPHPAPLQSFGMLNPAHNCFELIAKDLAGDPVTIFNQPLGVTLRYSDTDIHGIPEGSLGLYYWDTGTSNWIDAVTSCPGGRYTRNPNENILVLPLCHLTEFGLFGNSLYNFMPIVSR